MKQYTFSLLILAAFAMLFVMSPPVGHAESKEAPDQPAKDGEPEDTDPPEAYVGQMPDNDKLEVLAEHRVISTFQGQQYRRCRGRTGRCPDKCGSSGEFANFKVTDYLHYKKDGKYGDAKQKSYTVQISDFHRKPKGDPALLAYVNTLEEGDLVVIEWKHLYGEVSPGARSPVRPLLLLKKIDKDEAEKLKEQAEAEKDQEEKEE